MCVCVCVCVCALGGLAGPEVVSAVQSSPCLRFLVGHVLPDGALLSLTASGNPVTLLSDVK
jgi:hypothetical protein